MGCKHIDPETHWDKVSCEVLWESHWNGSHRQEAIG